MAEGTFSKSEEKLFEILRAEKDMTLQDIAEEMGRSYGSVRWYWREWKKANERELTEQEINGIMGKLNWELPLKLYELATPIPRIERKVEDGRTGVHFGDVHFPVQDDKAISILYQIIQDIDPDYVVDHGDDIDAYSVSKYPKDLVKRPDLSTEIEMAINHKRQIAQIAPHAARYYIPGNHTDRIERIIYAAAESGPMRQILQLPGVREAISLPSILQLDKMDWEYVPHYKILDHDVEPLIITHGSLTGVNHAQKEYKKHGTSGISGHIHKWDIHHENNPGRDDVWISMGCLCSLEPHYSAFSNWQQGFVVTTWHEGKMYYELVQIRGGKAAFRGKVYTG